MATLIWGLSDEKIGEEFPGSSFWKGNVTLKSGIKLSNFIGDCGALTLNGVSNCTVADLQEVERFASLGGFSKLFATIVSEKKYADISLARMKEAGWRCVSRGKSNRNPKNRDYVMFKRVKCVHKGY